MRRKRLEYNKMLSGIKLLLIWLCGLKEVNTLFRKQKSKRISWGASKFLLRTPRAPY